MLRLSGFLPTPVPGLRAVNVRARRSNLLIQPLRLGRRLDAEHDRQQLATATKRVHRLGMVACRCKRTHQTAIQRFREIVGFERATIDVDCAFEVAFALELLRDVH